MAELLQFSKEELHQHCDERNSKWLYNLARGIDLEAVTPRLVPKSISCSKMFPRQNALVDLPALTHWMHEIVKDVVERVEEDEYENNRRPKQIVVSFSQSVNSTDVSSSRAINFITNEEDKIVSDAIDVIKRNTAKFLKDDGCTLNNSIKFLGFNVSKFENFDTKRGKTIEDMFRKNFQKIEDQTMSVNQTNGPIENSSEPIASCSKNTDMANDFRANYNVEFNEDYADSSDEESQSNSQNDVLLEAANQMNRNLQKHLLVSPGPSTSTGPNYNQLYAENYQSSEELTKIECKQCKKMIVESEMQVHSDAHFAFQLNQEQRTEFKNQTTRPHTQITPVKKKQKLEPKKSSIKKGEASIQKFFAKRSEKSPEPSTSTANHIEVERCTECGKAIPIVDLFEHMDFHTAKRVQDEFMTTETKANRTYNNSEQKHIKNLSTSKGKKNTKKTDKTKNPAVRNITNFFQTIDQ